MCIFTHFAAGALVGGAMQNPAAALVGGLASHAVLDAIPHYDHPDWRVELAGGLAGLLLLTLLPFGSWAAAIGGIGGMLPDLENLLQKLGKMRRDQFVFPSHTGVIPHGRELGPRNLAWQAAIFVVCIVALGLLQPGDARAQIAGDGPGATPVRASSIVLARPVVELVESRAERTVVRVTFPVARQDADWAVVAPEAVDWWVAASRVVDDEGQEIALPRGTGFLAAVPTRETVRVQVRGVRWHRPPERVLDPASLVEVDEPRVSREVPAVRVRVVAEHGIAVLAAAEVVLEHAPSGREAGLLALGRGLEDKGSTRPEKAPAALINPRLHALLSLGAGEAAVQKRTRADGRADASKQAVENPFAATQNWVRIEIATTDVYRVTGSELSLWGVPTDQVDPDKLRLFRGGSLALHQLPEYPDSLETDRSGLNEVAIELRGIGDGEFNLTDSVAFYGVGTSTWRNDLDTVARPLDHYEHPYAQQAVYWLTWEGFTTPSPFPGAPRRVPTAATGPAPTVTLDRHLRRDHFEESYFDETGWVADDWIWDANIDFSRTLAFSLEDPIPATEATFVVDIRGLPDNRRYLRSTYVFSAESGINDDPDPATVSFTHGQQSDSVRVRLVGTTDLLQNGTNRLNLLNTTEVQDASGRDVKNPIALDSFDLLYWSELSKPSGRTAAFAHWGDQVTGGSENTRLQLALPDTRSVTWWDVSQADAVVALPAVQTDTPSPRVQVDLVREAATDRHFVVFAPGQERTVQGARVTPTPLETLLPDADYVVVYEERFAAAAAALVDLRSRSLEDLPDPRARAVTTRQIYDNYSGGQKDLYAIRNFLQGYYERSFGGPHPLRYVCFMGDASRDYRNYLGRDPAVDLFDFVPTGIRVPFPDPPHAFRYSAPYATDEEMTSFDDPTFYPDDPELASGRLPVRSAESALALVERIREYNDAPPPGNWSNTVVFVADDLHQPSGGDNQAGEIYHTREAELLANFYIPLALDMRKVFMADYEFPPGNSTYKPAARNDLLRYLSEGTTLFYYVGHGAENILADEQVFRTSDVTSLTNGARRYVFLAFSCDVGVFDDPDNQSMGETMVLLESGGGIASICASQVSFIGPNEDLSEAFFSNLYPEQHVDAVQTLGEALWLAKREIFPSNWANAQRYTVFGDPALHLPNPVDDLEFAATSLDTIRAGYRHTLRLDVASLGIPPGADVSYDARVEESAESHPYYGFNSMWRLGATIFRGTGPVQNDVLDIQFKAPLQIRAGERGRIRVIVRDDDQERSVALHVPVIRGAPPPSDDFVGPGVGLTMEDNRFRVRPGASIAAAVADTSGVAILGTNPGNSVLLEFDGTGFMTNVSDAFVFDPGSYQSGRLDISLPGDLDLGPHTAALYANDVLGNVGSDTLSFLVVPEGISGIIGTTLFPNPTPGPCRLVFELSDPMDVTWDIYTVAGRRIQTLRRNFGAGGPQTIEWDGRDHVGDEIANGVYLYVLRGHGAASGGRDIRQTGQLVIMR